MTQRFTSTLMLLVLSAACTACGSSDDTSTDTGDPSGTDDPIGTEDPVGDPDPVDDPMGMGDSVALPDHILTGTNGTMPCDPSFDTDYPGDELCILAAEPGTGAFFHAGPSDYDNPDEVATFILEPGQETTEYFVTESTNEEMVWFRDQHFRMRPGSHHLIMYQLELAEGEAPPEIGWYQRDEVARGMPWGGSQMYAMDFPEAGKLAPEDVNLARPLDARTRMAFEMHYVNATGEPIMREAWVNLMHNDVPADERVILGAPFLVGFDFSVPPATTQVINFNYEMPAADSGADMEVRIVSIFGHRHASTSRFSLWINRDGERALAYEDYDWAEAKEFFYNSVIENPEPDPTTYTAGASSGQIFVGTGDSIEWECEMTNTLDVNLEFGNGVYEKEMCNVFGTLTPMTFEAPAFLVGAPSSTVTTL